MVTLCPRKFQLMCSHVNIYENIFNVNKRIKHAGVNLERCIIFTPGQDFNAYIYM